MAILAPSATRTRSTEELSAGRPSGLSPSVGTSDPEATAGLAPKSACPPRRFGAAETSGFNEGSEGNDPGRELGSVEGVMGVDIFAGSPEGEPVDVGQRCEPTADVGAGATGASPGAAGPFSSL